MKTAPDIFGRELLDRLVEEYGRAAVFRAWAALQQVDLKTFGPQPHVSGVLTDQRALHPTRTAMEEASGIAFPWRSNRYTETEKATIATMLADGSPVREIAEKVGRTEASLYNAIDLHSLRPTAEHSPND